MVRLLKIGVISDVLRSGVGSRTDVRLTVDCGAMLISGAGARDVA
jgi:hypothetical protein